MADDPKQPRPRRSRFLLFVMYLAVYGALRLTGEVAGETTRIQVEQQTAVANIVIPDPSIPYWRQQIYRGLFSPCMVAEEEIHLMASGSGEGLVAGAVNAVRDLLQI